MMAMRRGVAVVVGVGLTLAGAARADAEELVEAFTFRGGGSITDRLADKLTQLGDEIDARLGPLSGDALDFRLDGRNRNLHLRVRGEGRGLGLRLGGNVHFDDGAAQVHATLDLAVVGQSLHLELPRFDLVPRSFAGEHYVELRLPLVEGSF